MRPFIATLLLVVLPLQTHAESFTCALPDGVDERTIEIEYPGDGPLPCRTLYTKFGERNEIASATFSEGVCERIARSVVRNLSAAGYDCGGVEGSPPALESTAPTPAVTPPAIAEPVPSTPEPAHHTAHRRYAEGVFQPGFVTHVDELLQYSRAMQLGYLMGVIDSRLTMVQWDLSHFPLMPYPKTFDGYTAYREDQTRELDLCLDRIPMEDLYDRFMLEIRLTSKDDFTLENAPPAKDLYAAAMTAQSMLADSCGLADVPESDN